MSGKMKMDQDRVYLVRVAVDGSPRWGVIENEQVYELDGTPFTHWVRGVEIGPLDGLQLLAPTVPSKIVCVGRNYPAYPPIRSCSSNRLAA
jgi:hypothetical protein